MCVGGRWCGVLPSDGEADDDTSNAAASNALVSANIGDSATEGMPRLVSWLPSSPPTPEPLVMLELCG